MKYELIKQIRDNDTLRHSFMDLAVKVFNLSFREWYEQGFWTDQYIPYVMTDHNKVIANASVNIMDIVWQGMPRRYIQIGTVMTDPEHRGEGLSRLLLEEILSDWKDRSDAIYLFANSTVLDFYPKFGFEKVLEYQYSMPLPSAGGSKERFQKLDMDSTVGREIVKRRYQASNPFSALAMADNYGLLMFYCGVFMKDCVYYSKDDDLVCVAEQEDDSFICYDIFGRAGCSLEAVIADMAAPGTRQVVLEFTPKDTLGCTISPISQEEDTLFLMSGKENIFVDHRIKFPALSHA